MDVEEENVPVFRPFTRDELASIENIIFENKLAAKKKAERRLKNIAEFGEGARARKMYENVSDDENDEEDKDVEPNPKLQQGNDLPRRFGEFPMELASTPICDIDSYYKDKRTFIVVSKSQSIFRFSASNALFLLSPFHPIRRIAIRVLVHPIFSTIVICTIMANCYVMMLPDTEYTASTEIVFTAIYTYESGVKLLARGFFMDRFTYLRDAWNWLDFLVILMSYVTIAIDLGNFSALRTFRVFRALKSVAVIPGLKTIVSAVIYSVKNLADVIILTLFGLYFFALLGLQFYMGVLSQICILDYDGPENPVSESTWHAWVSNESSWYVHPELDNHVMCGNGTGAGKCPEGATCLAGFGPNPNYGFTSFDNIMHSYLCAFRLMTQDFWENLYQITLRTAGPMHIIFFMFNIFLGSFYLINLILAIVAMSYDELQHIAEEEAQRELEELEAIKQAEEAALAEAEAAATEAAAAMDILDDFGEDNVSKNMDQGSHTDDMKYRPKSSIDSFEDPTRPLSAAIKPIIDQKDINRRTLSTSLNGLRDESALRRHDINVLQDIVDRVSPGIPSQMGDYHHHDDDDDDDEEEGKWKRVLAENLKSCFDIFCIWDCAWVWIRVSEVFAFIVFDPFTELFITLCIVVNVVFMALDHYTIEYDYNGGMSPFFTSLLTNGNYFFTAIFAVESFVKLGAMSPRYFFSDGWNIFDFIIVVLSFVELLADGVEGLSMLRSSRLLRVFKLAKSWKSLNDILKIMANTVGALSNLTVVLVIIIFIFAVMGMQLFGQDYYLNVCKRWECEMPRWNFTDFFHSFMIVFRVLCGEWIESMWDCIYVAGPTCVPYFLACVLVANLVILNLFLALLLSSFSDMGGNEGNDDGEPDKMQIAFERIRRFKRWIRTGIANTLCYLCRRKKIAAGDKPIPIAMVNGNALLQHPMGNGIKLGNGLQEKGGYPFDDKPPGMASHENGNGVIAQQVEQMYMAKIGKDMDTEIPNYPSEKAMMANGHTSTFAETIDISEEEVEVEPTDHSSDERLHEDVFYYPIDDVIVEDCCPAVVYRKMPCCLGDNTSPFWQVWNQHRLLGSKLIENKYFEGVVLILIMVSSFVMTLEDIWFDTRPVLIDTLYYLDRILTVVFFIETSLKLFAMGFVVYFGNAWCWLDFVIVAVSLINFGASLLGAGNIPIFKTMRTLRALRPLRAMAKMEGMKVVVNALVGALPSIFNVLLVCIIFWLIFAIIGVNTFMGKYYKCIDTTTGEKYSNEIIPDKQVCLEEGEPAKWVNSWVTFDNVGMAYLALLQVATWKGWIDVMNDAIDSVKRNHQPHKEVNIYMYLYFVFFIVFGSFFTLNLLVGVIIDKFNEQKNKGGSSLDAFMTEDQKKYIAAMKKASTKKPLKALPRPYWKPQAIIFGVITNKKFDMIIMAFIGLNMVTMSCDHYQQSTEWTMVLENMNLFFIVIFTAEMLLKIFALRQHYFTEPWNLFDFIVVILSLGGLFLSDLIEKYFVSPTLLRVVRVAKIGRVLRLIKGAKGIRTLLFSLVMAFPALINICLLLFLIMFIFSVFGMSLFKNVKIRPGFDDVHNFQTFGKTFTLLFQICTSAGWAEALVAIGQEDDCDEANPQIGSPGNCGKYMTGVAYIILYLVLSFLIIVNMYIAVILENYSQATEDVQDGITDEDYQLFYEIWQEFDPNGTQYIKYDHLAEFLEVLEPPLQIAMPNKYKIIQMDIPIVRFTSPKDGEIMDNCIFCADILDILTQDFFARKGRAIDEQQQHVEEVKVTTFADRPGYERISSTLWKQREHYCASLIKRAWKYHRLDRPSNNASGVSEKRVQNEPMS